MDKQTLIDRYLRYLATDAHLDQAQALGILTEEEVTALKEQRKGDQVPSQSELEEYRLYHEKTQEVLPR